MPTVRTTLLSTLLFATSAVATLPTSHADTPTSTTAITRAPTTAVTPMPLTHAPSPTLLGKPSRKIHVRAKATTSVRLHTLDALVGFVADGGFGGPYQMPALQLTGVRATSVAAVEMAVYAVMPANKAARTTSATRVLLANVTVSDRARTVWLPIGTLGRAFADWPHMPDHLQLEFVAASPGGKARRTDVRIDEVRLISAWLDPALGTGPWILP